MSIQLDYNEEFSKGLKRLMIEECKTAIRYLGKASKDEEKHKAVHEARKAFKKIRACLRLVRDHIDYYHEENRWFRDRGKEISDIRDATANIEVFFVLKNQYDFELYENAFNTLLKKLKQKRKKLIKPAFHNNNILAKLRNAVEKKADSIPGWPLDIQSFDDIYPGIKRTYKRGLKGLKNARKTEEVKDFHEWRKRAKYLRYQIDFLNRLWPQVLEAYEDEMHDITDLTGTINDLQNLRFTIRKFVNPFESREEKMLFDAILQKHENLMKKHSLLKGRKFYFDSPSDFTDRIETYWEIHQEEIKTENLPEPDHILST